MIDLIVELLTTLLAILETVYNIERELGEGE